MKRDMDLVREILLKVEKAETALLVDAFYSLDENKTLIHYHLDLLIKHGFLDGNLQGSWSSRVVYGQINGLTWDGQDFLEAMRSETVWKKAKSVIAGSVGSTTFDVIKYACVEVSKAMIKAQLEA